MRAIVAVVLSALTVVGGHFYNRRPDRALVFLAPVVLAPGLALLAMGLISSSGSMLVFAVLGWTLLLVVLTVVGSWIASMILSYRDARRPRTVIAAGFWGWRFSAAVLSVGAALLSVSALLFVGGNHRVIGFAFDAGLGRGETAYSLGTDENFWQYLHYGGDPASQRSLPAPPAGDGYLVGRIVYDDRPAAGVVLDLTLNGEYRTPPLTTDDDGRFTLRLPPGEWFINRVRTMAWAQRPAQGEFVLLSEQDPPLPAAGSYFRHTYHPGERGWRVPVAAQPPTRALEFTIRREVELEWPRGERERAQLADAIIAWRAYPGAATYVVTLHDVERRGNGWTSHEIATRRLGDATRLPLKTLNTTTGGKDEEYSVSVAAFAADGRLLSETRQTAHFVLTDGTRIVDDDLAARYPSADGKDLAAALAAAMSQEPQQVGHHKRLLAAEVLIDDGLTAEAERLLAKVDRAAAPGTKEALLGYLRARQGRCAEAKELFARAEAAAGKGCVADRWRAVCAAESSAR